MTRTELVRVVTGFGQEVLSPLMALSLAIEFGRPWWVGMSIWYLAEHLAEKIGGAA
jgi:hypothetical protein